MFVYYITAFFFRQLLCTIYFLIYFSKFEKITKKSKNIINDIEKITDM